MERRRENITRLISEAQKQYFEKGEMSEIRYYVRTKKYAELIRDINRQIPLLKEKLILNTGMKMFKKIKKENKKNETQKPN